MKEYSKQQKKILRELASKLYKIEMEIALNTLFQDFNNWKTSKLDCFDLNDQIHKFHNGISRELYNKYNQNKFYDLLIARGIVDNLLSINDIPEIIKEDIEKRIDLIKNNFD